MALTQQFARVSRTHPSDCRRAAAPDSPDGAPGWNPLPEDRLDTDWAIWGLLHHCRAAGGDARTAAVLDRAITGDAHEDVAFLDHPEVYDGFGAPPALLAPDAVTEVARALVALDLNAILAGLPASDPDAAGACGFGRGFTGDVRAYLTAHFDALRTFHREASRRGLCMVVWVD